MDTLNESTLELDIHGTKYKLKFRSEFAFDLIAFSKYLVEMGRMLWRNDDFTSVELK